MTDLKNSLPQICANCGSAQSALYCGQCGQHERGSRRLQVRDIATNCAEVLLEVESPLPATLIGLIRNPGRVCLDYVNGRRKRYLNPFAFLLVAVTAQFILSVVLRWTGWIVPLPEDADALPDEALNGLLFAIVVPQAFLWTKFFAVSHRNFAENYVLGLYLLGQFAWLELVLLPLTSFAAADTILLVAYPVAYLALATWAGSIFYAMSWMSVFWRMFLSTATTLVVSGGLFAAATAVVDYFRTVEIIT